MYIKWISVSYPLVFEFETVPVLCEAYGLSGQAEELPVRMTLLPPGWTAALEKLVGSWLKNRRVSTWQTADDDQKAL